MGTTESPQLPKPVEGRRYVDIAPGTTMAEFENLIRGFQVEVFAFAVDGEFRYAPLVGTRSEVRLWDGPPDLKDCVTIHNHPLGGVVSLDDFRSAVADDIASMVVVLPTSGRFKVDRPKKGWPPIKPLETSYLRGFERAQRRIKPNMNVAKKADVRMKEINSAFRHDFGEDAPEIVLE